MQRRHILLGAAAGAGLLLVGCRSVVMAEPQSQFDGATEAQIRQAIITSLRERKWVMQSEEPGVIHAQYVKGPHIVNIVVKYRNNAWKILPAKGSTLVNADGKVHPKYNQWVQTLNRDINANASILVHKK